MRLVGVVLIVVYAVAMPAMFVYLMHRAATADNRKREREQTREMREAEHKFLLRAASFGSEEEKGCGDIKHGGGSSGNSGYFNAFGRPRAFTADNAAPVDIVDRNSGYFLLVYVTGFLWRSSRRDKWWWQFTVRFVTAIYLFACKRQRPLRGRSKFPAAIQTTELPPVISPSHQFEIYSFLHAGVGTTTSVGHRIVSARPE
jgi:hypothetical protein